MQPWMKSFFVKILVVLASYGCTLWSSIPPELQNLPYGVYPDTPGYNIERFNYNKRFNVHPKAIFNPRTYHEAVYVLSSLKEYRLDFAVRSGGHCFEPGSLSNDYILDLGEFNAIIPSIEKEEVFIGAGARLQDVINTLES